MAEKATNMTGTPFPDKETELTISDMTDEQLVSRITQTGGEKYATVLIKRYIPVISAKSAKMTPPTALVSWSSRPLGLPK